MKRILVTGAAGFIGSNVLEYLCSKKSQEAGEDLRVTAVVDKLTYAANKSNLDLQISKAPCPVSFYKSDIFDASWGYILKKEDPDVFINFAAESHVDNSLMIHTMDDFFKSNSHSVVRIVNAIRKHNKTNKKDIYFIQISTDEVLGDTPVNSTEEFDEEHPLNPNNPYSATKASAELLIKSIYHSYGDFSHTIVRATNNYGPHQHFEKFIPTVIKNAVTDSRIPVYGSGANVREWLWVNDFAIGLEILIRKFFKERRKVVNETFHFGSGERVSNLEIVETILEVMKKPRSLIKFVQDRPGHDQRYALNSQKAWGVLGWKASMDLEEGLRIVVKDITSRIQ